MSEWNDETAEWYASRYGEYPTNRLAVDVLKLAPDTAIVDIGCGTGAALRHAASRVPAGRLIGVDPVGRMLEIARERAVAHSHGACIEFRRGVASALPVADDAADVVLAFDSFDHWQDKPRGLAEVRRVLRPGGRLVVVKDRGVPDATDAIPAFLAALMDASFEVCEERNIDHDEVSFTMWVCRASM